MPRQIVAKAFDVQCSRPGWLVSPGQRKRVNKAHDVGIEGNGSGGSADSVDTSVEGHIRDSKGSEQRRRVVAEKKR